MTKRTIFKMSFQYLVATLGAITLLSSQCSASDPRKMGKRDLSPPSTLPGTWRYEGCYTDVIGRTLEGASYSSLDSMTDESCISFCTNKGFIYSGTTYASQCFCGAFLAPGTVSVTDNGTFCDMPCTGNASEPCGGINLLSLFWSGLSGPQTDPGFGLWSFFGCYSEPKSGRTLPHEVPVPGGSSNMTVKNCCFSCQAQGFNLAGVEYAQECWCGKDMFTDGGAPAPATPDGLSGCNALCTGNLSEYCGGSSRLNVYNFNNSIATVTASAPNPTAMLGIKPTIGPFTYFGCQSEGNLTRALTPGFNASDAMTLESCETTCFSYTYFGTEYGRECYCGNTIAPSSTKLPDTDCSFLCPGNTNEYCGASNILSVYVHKNSTG